MNLLFLSNWHCCVLVTTQSIADHCLHVLAICCHQRAACVVVVGPSANHREDQSYNIQSVEVKLLQMLQTIKSVHCSQCLIFSGGVAIPTLSSLPFLFSANQHSAYLLHADGFSQGLQSSIHKILHSVQQYTCTNGHELGIGSMNSRFSK